MIQIAKPGTVIINPNGEVTIRDFVFDCSHKSPSGQNASDVVALWAIQQLAQNGVNGCSGEGAL